MTRSTIALLTLSIAVATLGEPRGPSLAIAGLGAITAIVDHLTGRDGA